MQDKQKVTLYLPQGIHRQLKIRAAVDEESMSTLVEKAVGFYLKHPEKIEEIEASAYGKTHQVHICPECEAAMVMREGEMVSLKQQPSVIAEEIPLEIRETVNGKPQRTEKEALVTC
jgi:plasmid stability protein